MLSKILPFNRTLLQKDWKLDKWIVYGFVLVLMISGPYAAWMKIQEFFMRLSQFHETGDIYFYGMQPEYLMNGQFVYKLMFLIPVLIAILMTGEEKRRRTIEISIAGPYSRYTIFFNKMVLGIFAITVPIAVTGLIFFLLIAFSSHIATFITGRMVILWMFKSVMIGISMFSFATLIGMLCSSFMVQALLTLIFMLFPVGFISLLSENFSRLNLTAFEDGWEALLSMAESITPALYFGTLSDLDGGMALSYGLTMLVISITIIVISGVLFDIYKVEKGPEVLTFEKTEIVFRIGVVVCSVMLCGVLVDGLVMRNGLVGLFIGYIIGGVIGYFIPKYWIMRNRVA